MVPDKDVAKETRRRWLLELCLNFIDKYLIQKEVQPLVQQVEELDDSLTNGFNCRVQGCNNKNYIHHSARVK